MEIKIAKLYLFFLPFRMIMPFEFLKLIVGPLANYFDTVFLMIGLSLWLFNGKGVRILSTNMPLLRTTCNSVLYLNISSIVMASVMYFTYGNFNGQSPFIAVMPMILFYFQYLLIFVYNNRVFQLLSYSTVVGIINKTCKVLLIIGYIQVLVILGIGGSVYDFISSIIGGFVNSSSIYKLPLTATEGAGAGGLLGIFVFPFLMSRYLHGHKGSLYQIILWLLPLYFTHSSTAYLLFALDLGIFFIILVKRFNGFVNVMRIGVVSVIILTGMTASSPEIRNEISYMLIEKATDTDNGSTVSRMTPYIINWGCFTEMPLMGVGNGLQGYFYEKYFPKEFLNVPGTDLGVFYEKINEPGTIANGACFLPGYFSGYGIVGLLVLINFIFALRRTRKLRKKELGLFNEMFIIGSVAFLVMSISSEMYCLYYAWFVLSIPFMYFQNNTSRERISAN